MDIPPAPPDRPDSAPGTEPPPDRLGAEVRDSVMLLALSVCVTAGLAGGAQALLSLLS